jgi:hypothetical protein
MRRQERKNAVRLQKMTRNRLRIQQLTLNIRTSLHTKIIVDDHHRQATATRIIQGIPSRDEFQCGARSIQP